MGKHAWTLDEDLFCCKACVRYFVIEKNHIPINDLVQELATKLPNIPSSSIRMKVQNIKQLMEESGIDNTLDIKPLANYSKKNERAMKIALAESY